MVGFPPIAARFLGPTGRLLPSRGVRAIFADVPLPPDSRGSGGKGGKVTDDKNQETILYGLATCDTCRKAVRALRAAGRPVTLRDVRAEPLDPAERAAFLAAFGDRLVNRASATWRGLDEAARRAAPDALLAAHPALMKRPVVKRGGNLWLGWDKSVQADVLK